MINADSTHSLGLLLNTSGQAEEVQHVCLVHVGDTMPGSTSFLRTQTKEELAHEGYFENIRSTSKGEMQVIF